MSSHMVGYDKKWLNQRRIIVVSTFNDTHISIQTFNRQIFTELELSTFTTSANRKHEQNPLFKWQGVNCSFKRKNMVHWNLTWLQTDPFFVQENRPKPALVAKSREKIIWHRHNAGCGGRFDQCQHMSTTRGTCVFDKGKKSFMLMCYWKTSSWKIALIVPTNARKFVIQANCHVMTPWCK